MNDKESYWFKLISYWVRHLKRTGLTIPFIIGARKYFDAESEIDSVSSLLNKIKDSNIDKRVVLNSCPNVREFVLGMPSDPDSMYGEDVPNQTTGNSTLRTTTSTDILGKDFRSKRDKLQEMYASCIAEEKYSREHGTWINYTAEDIEMIMKAKEHCQ